MTDTSRILSVEDMLNADDVKTDTISIPEWGGSIVIGSLNAETMLNFALRRSDEDRERAKLAGADLIVQSLVKVTETAGQPRVIERIGKPEQNVLFMKKDAAVINRICDKIFELNGFGQKPEGDRPNRSDETR